MQSFLSLEILFLKLITPTLLCITFGCNFTDIIDVSLRLGHDFSTMICSAPIGFHKRIGYNINIMRQSACLVFNPITVNNFASLFNCMPVGRASDSMMAPT